MTKNELKLVLTGETGIGKSQLGNFILQQEDRFTVGDGDNSETYSFQENTAFIKDMNMNITIMDTPGLNDTSNRDFDIMNTLIEKFQNDRSIDGIILVYSFTKPRKVSKDGELILNLKKIFGEDILKQRLKVIVTNRSTGKQFEKEKHKVQKQTKDIISFLDLKINEEDIIFVNTTYIQDYIDLFYPEIKKLLQKFYEIKKNHGSMDNERVKKVEMEIIERKKKEEEERLRKVKEENEKLKKELEDKNNRSNETREGDDYLELINNIDNYLYKYDDLIRKVNNEICDSEKEIENLKNLIKNDNAGIAASSTFVLFTLGFSGFGIDHCLESKKKHNNQLEQEKNRLNSLKAAKSEYESKKSEYERKKYELEEKHKKLFEEKFQNFMKKN